MKTQYTFGFIDEPQFRTPCTSRQWLANYLRACRAQPYIRVKRAPWPAGAGYRTAQYCYSVWKVGSTAEALIFPAARNA